MNFSNISNQSVLGKVLRLPLSLLPKKMRVPILQGRLKGKKWIVGASDHGCWLGSYEFEKQLLFEQTVTKGSVVFDLGGHVGFYTLLASELVGTNGKVFVFEPIQKNIFYLKEHVRLNKAENVKVIEAAVSDHCGEIFLDEGLSSSQWHISANGKHQVKSVGLDEMISKGELPVPDFMKIDIEGAETLALTGAKKMLTESHPTIFLATHGKDIHEECCRLLLSFGYEVKPIGELTESEYQEIIATFKKN